MPSGGKASPQVHFEESGKGLGMDIWKKARIVRVNDNGLVITEDIDSGSTRCFTMNVVEGFVNPDFDERTLRCGGTVCLGIGETGTVREAILID